MRIYYDHQVFSLHDAGGAPRYFFQLIRHLQAFHALRLELVLGFNSSVFPFTELTQENTRVSAMRSTMRPGAYRYLLNELRGFPQDVLRGKVDIYHPTLYRASLAVRRQRMVVTHHDCTHERYPQLFKNAQLVIENKRRLYQAADAIICVSESSRRDLMRYHDVSQAKTHVVHHGFTNFEAKQVSASGDLRVEKPYILFVGNRGTYKNFLVLLEAYHLSGLQSSYDLLAVGGGEFTVAEVKRIGELGLLEQVRLIARATEAQLADAYRAAATFVYPSLYEGFGFPPLEAMSLGCPVIASDTSSLPEICGEAAVYFNPGEPIELAATLQSILNDQSLQMSIREIGFAQVRLYDWRVAAIKTLKVYEDVLN